MMMRRLVHRLVVVLVAGGLGILALASDAAACPVCFAADERTRASFVHTAILLSVLPFALFVAIAVWLFRELGRDPGTDREPGPTPRPNAG